MNLRNPTAKMYYNLCLSFFNCAEAWYLHPVEERIAIWQTLKSLHGRKRLRRHGRWLTAVLDAIEARARKEAYDGD